MQQYKGLNATQKSNEFTKEVLLEVQIATSDYGTVRDINSCFNR